MRPQKTLQQAIVLALVLSVTLACQMFTRGLDQLTGTSAIAIGESFTTGDYDVKLIQVVEWSEVTLLDAYGFNAIPPKQSEHKWLVVTIEAGSNQASSLIDMGQLASALGLSGGDSVILDSSGTRYELSAVGSPIPTGQGWFITQIQEQTPSMMAVVFVDPRGGSVFITPGGSQKLVVIPNPLKEGKIDFGNNSVLADPAGPKWFVGLEKAGQDTGKAAQFSLLFEIPKNATGLQWQFLGSPSVKLPQPVVGTNPTEPGEGGFSITSMTLTFSEMCGAWDTILLCR